jgi:hypothetical protein
MLAAGAAFFPPVQTWVARKALASMAPGGASLDRVSVGLSRMSLIGLRLERDGSVLVVPGADAELGVISAGLGMGYLVKSLVARGWTLDLARSRVAGSPPLAPVSQKARDSWTARTIGGLIAAFNVPANLSLERVELEGKVILPDDGGRPAGTASVVITGGGLAAGRDGNFLCTAVVTLEDPAAPVSSVSVQATLAATMDGSGTFTRSDMRADATASGPQFPGGIGLSCAASAARSARGKTYSFALMRGTERVAAIDAVSPDGSRRLAGSWRLDLKDTDLAPFALGHRLPAFYAAGTGSYELDASTGDVHAMGKIHGSADRLGVVAAGLSALGRVELAADFNVARIGDSLRVDRLETSLSGAAPVASVRALQPFEFNVATGELKVGRPSGDLVGISIKALPLSWLKGPLAGIDLVGSDAQGEFAMRAQDGRLALRTKAPLVVKGVALSRDGRPMASGLELSAFALADYSPQGWQVQLAPFAIRSEGIEVLSLEARLGWLAGTGQAAKAAGSWSASLPALMSQPGAAFLPRLMGGDASGSFEASLGSTCELRVKLALRKLALASAQPVALPSITSDARADFDGNGSTTFNMPFRLDYGTRSAEMSLAGTLSWRNDGPTVVATLSGGKISIDDIRTAAALSGAAAAEAAPADESAPPRSAAPFWPGVRGVLTVRLESLALPRLDLRDLRGTVLIDPASLGLQASSASFGDGSGARIDGALSFAPGAERRYSYRANVYLDNVDSASLFRAIDPDKPPAIDGRFDLSGRLAGGAKGPENLLQGAQGECKLSSKDGKFRVLRTDVTESIKQASSRLVGAVDTVTSLFGKKADKIGEALVESASGLSEIQYDQMNISAERGADLDVRFTEINLIAPEERITGAGRITHVEGVALQAQPLSVDLEMGARGRLGKILGVVGMLKDGRDELGYTQLYQAIHLGGTLQNIDQSQWREMLIQAPLRKGGGLFDKLLGR